MDTSPSLFSTAECVLVRVRAQITEMEKSREEVGKVDIMMCKGSNIILHHRRSAFTLVEILIVVVILGILAAIVIPQFTNASVEASAASLREQLQSVRSQIEVYKVRHEGQMPPFGTNGLASDWDCLVHPSDEWAYLQSAPYNPFTHSPGIGTSASVDIGWVWDDVAGQITAPYFDEIAGTYSPP